MVTREDAYGQQTGRRSEQLLRLESFSPVHMRLDSYHLYSLIDEEAKNETTPVEGRASS